MGVLEGVSKIGREKGKKIKNVTRVSFVGMETSGSVINSGFENAQKRKLRAVLRQGGKE